MLAAYLLSLPVSGEEEPPQTESQTNNPESEQPPEQERESSSQSEEELTSSLSLSDVQAEWNPETSEAVFTAVLFASNTNHLKVEFILPELTKEEKILGRDTVTSYETEGLGENEHWEYELKEDKQRKAVFTLISDNVSQEPLPTPRTFTITIHAAPDESWKRYLNAHPWDEEVLKQEAIVIVGSETGEVHGAASTSMTSSAKRSASADLYAKKVWEDTGLERKRPESITFDLYRREEDSSLTPMGDAYRKTIRVEGDEQSVVWKELPAGAYVIKELPIEGYSVREDIEEYKDSELHVFTNTIINSTVLHLSKQITDSNLLPIRKDACIHLILETYKQKINETEIHKINEENITLFTENGSLEWDSEPLPLSSSEGEYFYKLIETDTEGYEVYYTWNDEVYPRAQWESSSLGLMRRGTLTITNQEKISEYRLPSTGGPGNRTDLLLPLLFVLISSFIKQFTLRKDHRE